MLTIYTLSRQLLKFCINKQEIYAVQLLEIFVVIGIIKGCMYFLEDWVREHVFHNILKRKQGSTCITTW